LRAERQLIRARTTIFSGPVLVHGAVLQMKLSYGSTTTASAAGFVGNL
jgi:hypothetical protein